MLSLLDRDLGGECKPQCSFLCFSAEACGWSEPWTGALRTPGPCLPTVIHQVGDFAQARQPQFHHLSHVRINASWIPGFFDLLREDCLLRLNVCCSLLHLLFPSLTSVSLVKDFVIWWCHLGTFILSVPYNFLPESGPKAALLLSGDPWYC